MTDQKREYANGTYLLNRLPWGIYTGGAAMCSDGRVRKLCRIAATADTFFSVPASVRVKGKTVAGYITCDETEEGERIVEFRAYEYRKNHYLLPNKK